MTYIEYSKERFSILILCWLRFQNFGSIQDTSIDNGITYFRMVLIQKLNIKRVSGQIFKKSQFATFILFGRIRNKQSICICFKKEWRTKLPYCYYPLSTINNNYQKNREFDSETKNMSIIKLSNPIGWLAWI